MEDKFVVKGLEGIYETRHSSKKDSDYTALFLKIGPNYEKIVFLSKAELNILKAYIDK